MNTGDVRISRGMLGAALVMFLLPFITVSCGAQDITLTGAQLTTGTIVMGQRMGPQFDVVFALVGGLLALGATWMHGKVGAQVATIVTAAFAGSGFGWLQIFKFRQELSVANSDVPVTTSFNAGFWLASLLLFGTAALNVWHIVQHRRSATVSAAPTNATTAFGTTAFPVEGTAAAPFEPRAVSAEASGAGEQARE